MGIRANTKYSGVVRPGSELIETQNGTMGYQVMLACDDGDASFTIWLTEKNRKRAVRYFEVLEVTQEQLAVSGYMEWQLGIDIQGKEVSFGTREDEWNGKPRVVVGWIGKKADPNIGKAAADFFVQTPQEEDAPAAPSDDEIPF